MTDLNQQEMDTLAIDISRSCGLSQNHCRNVLKAIGESEAVMLAIGVNSAPTPQTPMEEIPPIGGISEPAAKVPRRSRKSTETVSGEPVVDEPSFPGVPDLPATPLET